MPANYARSKAIHLSIVGKAQRNKNHSVVTALETATMSHVTTSEVGIKPPLLAST
jgi:hypothetical protein